MTTKVYFNSTSLLLPHTGIRQYTLSLLTELVKFDDIESYYFYLTRWSDRFGSVERNTGSPRLWKLKNVLRDNFPNILEFQHFVRGLLFRRGLKGGVNSVYHELNFLPFETQLPTVITVHDLSFLRYPETHPAARVKFMASRLPRAVESATYVITDSEFVRQELIAEYSLPPEKVVAILLGAGEEFVPQPAEKVGSVLSRYGLQDQQYLLAVGTLEPRKNLVTAIRAFADLPASVRREYSLVLAGLWGWHNEELDKLLGPLVARGEVKVLGFVPDHDLPALYAGALLFVYPSLYEGFGLPPLEAMACGTPVISSNRASLPEVVGDAGIQVEAKDVAALKEAMLRLIESPEERARCSVLGLERARRFSWAKTAAETVAVYLKAVRG
jgi:glycosyltransferase involved in cell wall biosynthesis